MFAATEIQSGQELLYDSFNHQGVNVEPEILTVPQDKGHMWFPVVCRQSIMWLEVTIDLIGDHWV